MEIAIGTVSKATTIETEERKAAISLDKGEKLVVVLGINRVQIEYINGAWTATHGPNVLTSVLLRSDEKAFSPVGSKLHEELE
jgi:hypothetical protein